MRTLSTDQKHLKLRVILRQFLPKFNRIETTKLTDLKSNSQKYNNLQKEIDKDENSLKIFQQIKDKEKILFQLKSDLEQVNKVSVLAGKYGENGAKTRLVGYLNNAFEYTKNINFKDLAVKIENNDVSSPKLETQNLFISEINKIEKNITQLEKSKTFLNDNAGKISLLNQIIEEGYKIQSEVNSEPTAYLIRDEYNTALLKWTNLYNSYFVASKIKQNTISNIDPYIANAQREKQLYIEEIAKAKKAGLEDKDYLIFANLNKKRQALNDIRTAYAKSALSVNYVERFAVDVAETGKDYYIFDLTNYVSSYTVGNGINQKISTWSITFKDNIDFDIESDMFKSMLFSSSLLNSQSVNISTFNSDRFFNHLAEYASYTDCITTDETINDNNFDIETELFKETRTYGSKGIRKIKLSDLIQVFNFITLEICENAESSSPIYKYEFAGFVKDKQRTNAAGGMPTIHVNGVGCLGLLGQSRRVYENSLLKSTLFDYSEMSDLKFLGEDDIRAVSAFQNMNQNKTPLEIFEQNFRCIYRIHNNSNILTTQAKKDFYFIDESLIKSEIALSRNLFAIPSLLYAWYMKELGIAVKTFKDTTKETTFLQKLSNKAEEFLRNPNLAKNSTNTLQTLWNNTYKKELDTLTEISFHRIPSLVELNLDNLNKSYSYLNGFPKVPLLITDLGNLRAFFKQFAKLHIDWDTSTQTPLEVFNTVLKETFLELIELPDGRIWIRGPKYNINDYAVEKVSPSFQESTGIMPSTIYWGDDRTTWNQQLKKATLSSAVLPDFCLLHTSDNKHVRESTNILTSKNGIDIISTSYTEDISQIRSKQKLKFLIDYGIDMPFAIAYYTNGKILSQFGVHESDAFTNANMRWKKINVNKQVEHTNLNLNRIKSSTQIAKCLLNLNNANSKTGNIEAVGTSTLLLGNCIFDSEERKFGYIVKYHKTCSVGGNYTMSLSLNFVRDAYEITEGDLDTLETIDIGKFSDYILPYSES